MILLFTGCRPPAWVFACLVSESMHCFQHFWCPWLLSASLVSGMLWILCPWLLIMAVLRSLCTSGSCLPTLAGLPAWLISYFQLPLPIWRGFFLTCFWSTAIVHSPRANIYLEREVEEQRGNAFLEGGNAGLAWSARLAFWELNPRKASKESERNLDAGMRQNVFHCW